MNPSLLFLFLLILALSCPAQGQRPNVLFIICDDLNTHLSTSGYPHIKTPAFDRLAASGMNFRRAYCQYPVCGPSRASLLSGLYPESTGVISNTVDIRETRPGTMSLPQLFKESGYWTAAVGKIFHTEKTDHGDLAWHEFPGWFRNDEMPVGAKARKEFVATHGPIQKQKKKWEQFQWDYATQLRNQHVGYGPSGLLDEQHKDGKNADAIARWLDEKTHGDRPFFIACGIQKPHVPFLAPDKYFAMYPREQLTLDPVSGDFWKESPKMAGTGRWKAFGFEHLKENDSLRREYVQAYHACISFIDAQIGKVFDALERNGHWDDTIVILTSDHGYLLGDKFMWGKVMLFELCDKVPLVIRVPGQFEKGATQPGSSSDETVELLDLFPTLTDLCHLEAPKDLQGTSLVPMLKDPSLTGRDYAYTVVERGQGRLGRAIRTRHWRYTKWPDGAEELYDLRKDPKENHNLASSDKHAASLTRMRKHLKEAITAASSARKAKP